MLSIQHHGRRLSWKSWRWVNSLRSEKRTIFQLRKTHTTTSGLPSSYLQWNAMTKASFSITSISQIKRVTVIGAGLMGSGIAQVSAQAGFQVILTDTQPTQLTKTKHTLETALTKWTDHQKKTHHVPDLTLPKVTFTSDLMEALVDTDVVIEAIVENLSMKHTVFKTLDTHAPPHTLLVTNTSSIPIQAITQVVSKARLPWVAGMHFFNPVPRMALVELIATPTTDPLMMEILTSFCKHLGKVPVICKDTPGFIVNRLLVPYMMEAIKLAERGDASIQDIDTAMKLGAGYPMGPFELADFVGLDTLQFIVRGWYENGGEELKGNPMVKPSSSLDQLIRHGKLGRKSGAGFYDYSKKANM